MIIIDFVLLSLALLLLVPLSVLVVQIVAALLPASRQVIASSQPTSTVCLLMPAHNEATGISEVLRALVPQLDAQVRLLVVADNCSDNTAQIVRSMALEIGSAPGQLEVVERTDELRRGKGYALDYGVRHLEKTPPAFVIIVDADCVIQPGSIETLVQCCAESGRPAQALYLMKSPPGALIKSRVAEFAWLVRNQVRALGFHRLGLPCQLMGTGMVFSWSQISRATLNSGHIVEDMKLGVDLARVGTPPQFCPQALVTSYFPSSQEGLQSQRTRWEHGHMGVIMAEVPQLLMQGVGSGNIPLLALALDLCVPPLALLALLTGAMVMMSGAYHFLLGGSVLPAVLSFLSCLVFVIAIGVAWLRFGRNIISLRQLAFVPVYVLTKIPLYIFFFLKRQVVWVRSKRDGE